MPRRSGEGTKIVFHTHFAAFSKSLKLLSSGTKTSNTVETRVTLIMVNSRKQKIFISMERIDPESPLKVWHKRTGPLLELLT